MSLKVHFHEIFWFRLLWPMNPTGLLRAHLKCFRFFVFQISKKILILHFTHSKYVKFHLAYTRYTVKCTLCFLGILRISFCIFVYALSSAQENLANSAVLSIPSNLFCTFCSCKISFFIPSIHAFHSHDSAKAPK